MSQKTQAVVFAVAISLDFVSRREVVVAVVVTPAGLDEAAECQIASAGFEFAADAAEQAAAFDVDVRTRAIFRVAAGNTGETLPTLPGRDP